MAFRNPNYWRSMMTRLGGNSSFATSTTPKMKSYAPTSDFGHVDDTKPRSVKGEFVPVYVAIGMIVLSVSFGIHTAMHQLKRAPNVNVRKSRRETIPEITDPDRVIDESKKFIENSFFRKVAHVQDFDRQDVVPNPIRGDIYAHKPYKAVTLKEAGVDPKIPDRKSFV